MLFLLDKDFKQNFPKSRTSSREKNCFLGIFKKFVQVSHKLIINVQLLLSFLLPFSFETFLFLFRFCFHTLAPSVSANTNSVSFIYFVDPPEADMRGLRRPRRPLFSIEAVNTCVRFDPYLF